MAKNRDTLLRIESEEEVWAQTQNNNVVLLKGRIAENNGQKCGQLCENMEKLRESPRRNDYLHQSGVQQNNQNSYRAQEEQTDPEYDLF